MAHGRKLMGNPKVGDGIRIAAGVYLIYLAYQILKDGIIGGEMTGRSYAAGIIFSILFIVGGAGIAAFSVRHLMRLRKEEGQQKALQDKAATETGETTEFAEASEVPEEETETQESTEEIPEEKNQDQTASDIEAPAEKTQNPD